MLWRISSIQKGSFDHVRCNIADTNVKDEILDNRMGRKREGGFQERDSVATTGPTSVISCFFLDSQDNNFLLKYYLIHLRQKV